MATAVGPGHAGARTGPCRFLRYGPRPPQTASGPNAVAGASGGRACRHPGAGGRVQDLTFLQNLAVVMMAAALAAIVCDRLRVPRLLGFIGAGFVIGPHALPIPLVADETTIRTLGDLGILFLFPSLGISFNLRKMRRVGLPALLVALLDVGVMVWLGWMVGGALVWGRVGGRFLGVMIGDFSH